MKVPPQRYIGRVQERVSKPTSWILPGSKLRLFYTILSRGARRTFKRWTKTNMENKNREVLNDFIYYCDQHSEQRFWQALTNWLGDDSVIWIESLDENGNSLRFRDAFGRQGK